MDNSSSITSFVVISLQGDQAVGLYDAQLQLIQALDRPIQNLLSTIIANYPNSWIVWVQQSLMDYLNWEYLPSVMTHTHSIYSYAPRNYVPETIGYVDFSPFIQSDKQVKYASWQMSAEVGLAHARILQTIPWEKYKKQSWAYILCSLAKLQMPNGLNAYSDPNLLQQSAPSTVVQPMRTAELFRFVKQHYKAIWSFILLAHVMLRHRKFPILALVQNLGAPHLGEKVPPLPTIGLPHSTEPVPYAAVDVVIPTLGRAHCLYDFLNDLRVQTVLPRSIIIIEQQAQEGALSDLNYLDQEQWPFAIHHELIYRLGACHARNRALAAVQSEWVFLADDDIRIQPDFMERVQKQLAEFQLTAATISCLQKGEKEHNTSIHQFPFFGTCSSFVQKKYLDRIRFNLQYEFGYGEDLDFGMQLRRLGCDIHYLPSPSILHLKAPIGGFRTSFKQLWADESIQPKPSPTVMLYRQSHYTPQQLEGEKWVMWLKFYRLQSIKNPVKYLRSMRERWQASLYWAEKL